jgi:hypothetical protein
MPDYRCDVLRNRCIYDDRGNIVFDPGGGGRFEAGLVVDGGHLWFPLLEDVMKLFEKSRFHPQKVHVLHGYIDNNNAIMNTIDYSLGNVKRTPDNDDRVSAPHRPMSMVIDAYK